MLEALLISQIVLWIALLGLAAVVLALIRQIGVLHERIAPMGALTIDRGPRVGDPAPVFDLFDIHQRPVSVGRRAADGGSIFLMFVSPSCPVCKKLIPVVKSIVKNEPGVNLVFASDGDPTEQERFFRGPAHSRLSVGAIDRTGNGLSHRQTPLCGANRRAGNGPRQGAGQHARASGEHPAG